MLISFPIVWFFCTKQIKLKLNSQVRYITGVKPVRALEVLLELKELIKEITGIQPQHGAPIPSPLLEKTAQIVVKDSPANNCI